MIRRWYARARQFALSTVVGAASLGLVPDSASGGTATTALFGSAEVGFPDLSYFPKWTEVVRRFETDAAKGLDLCQEIAATRCPATAWREHVTSLQGQNLAEQLSAVNRFFNELPYIIDRNNWGVEDHWSTPYELMLRGGDCEDFAVAKYFMLKELGVAGDQMRIVVLHDANLRVDHAVLAVYTEGGIIVLDNQAPQPVPAERIVHYRPHYSINERFWYFHQKN